MPLDGSSYDPVLALLLRGRARVAAGWCQGAPQRGAAYCAWGAIWDAETRDDSRSETRRCAMAAEDCLNRAVPWYWRVWGTVAAAIAYNDSARRTQAQVVRLYDRAVVRRLEDKALLTRATAL